LNSPDAPPAEEGKYSEPLTLQQVEKTWGRGKDAFAALGLSLLTFIVLFATVNDYGITWDEAAPNFVAARKQSEWFRQVFTLEHPFSEETIDQYWQSPSTHPSLTRSLMALSLILFEDSLGEVAAMRMPSLLLAAFLVFLLYYWLARRVNTIVALGAVAMWITMPRVFGHVHIASLDVPMTVWWALVVVLFYEGAQRPRFSRWHMMTGLAYGLALSTKLHSFFLPFPLILWMLWTRRWYAWRNFVAMAVLGPIVYLGTQIYLWHHFWLRLLERFITYSTKDTAAPVKIFYFGRQFFDSTPWHYPLLMTLITLPAATLFFLILGSIGLYRMKPKSQLRPLILLNVLVPASLITLPHAQGYDGIRLILPALPWLAILGGLGLDRLVHGVRNWTTPARGTAGKFILTLCFLALFLPNFWNLHKHHPFHLEYYADWLGGPAGGKRLGMESTYWCDALQPDLLNLLNQKIPDGAKLRPLAMSYGVLEAYQRMGRLKRTILIGGAPPYDYHLLQCRQGFFGRTEWDFYIGQFGRPLATIEHDSVPFFMFFGPLQGQSLMRGTT